MAAYLARPSTAPVGANRYEITDQGNTNMKVVVRVRPESESEIGSGSQGVVKVLDEHVLVFDPHPDNEPSFQQLSGQRRRPLLGKKRKDLRFAFDRVFDETSSQVEVFEHTTRAVIDGVLNGVNCSVFAYGATGAGKTYTMLGNLESPGVMFLTMMELYRRINDLRDEKICEVAVSYCEVYNETIRDLLVSSGPLELREDSQKGLVVSGLSQHQPHTANEILNMLEIGNKNRTQHPTDANATSSRSHAVFQVFVHQKARTASLSTEVTRAKMSLIDLAGSERATMTTNRGARMREGANINKSLLALGNCINALADNKGKVVHVPYRNSKLTRLLKDSLGGNCRTVMIANLSPSELSYEDTYNTLKYADRAKQIKTKCVRNVLKVDFHIARYPQIIQELQEEVAELKAKLDKKNPKRHTFDPSEATRLQGLVQSVYGERSRLRKHMAELDASHRDTLFRICRKEREVQRISTLSGCESKKAKIAARIESLRHHIGSTEKQKQTVNEYIFSNNESIGRIQAEINTSVGGSSASPGLRQMMEVVTENKKLEAENAYQWKQTKHLLKYIRTQERETARTERILTLALDLVRRQHTMLRASNALTSNLQDSYESLVRLAEGGKEVAWADMSNDSLHETSLSQSQHTLFESFLVHASPARQAIVTGPNSPSIAASLGILTSATETQQADRGSSMPGATPRSSRRSITHHPLAERRTMDKVAPGPSLSPKVDTPTSGSSSKEPRSAVSSLAKPQLPAPSLFEDSSSSVTVSSCSTYNTRLNTVLNSSLSRSSPAYLKRPLPTSFSSAVSGRVDVQPYTMPRTAPKGTPAGPATLKRSPDVSQGPIYESIDFTAPSRPFISSPPPQLSGTFPRRSAPKVPLPTTLNPFDDNFVSPQVRQKRPLPRTPVPTYASVPSSPSLQSLPSRFNHMGLPMQLGGGGTTQAVLCRPFPSPSSAFVAGSNHQRFGSQLQCSSMMSNGVHSLQTSSIGSSFASPSITTTSGVASNPYATIGHCSSGVSQLRAGAATTLQSTRPTFATTSGVANNPYATSGVASNPYATIGHCSSGVSQPQSVVSTTLNSTRPTSAFSSLSALHSTTPRVTPSLSQGSVCFPQNQPLPPPPNRPAPLPPSRAPSVPRKSPPLDRHQEAKSMEPESDRRLDSTFTISRGVRAASVGQLTYLEEKKPHTGSSMKRSGDTNGQRGGLVRSQTTSSLTMLHVNAPKSLQDRPRTTEKGIGLSGQLRKVPSYLQLTKSAASKRVQRVNDKENQTSSSAGKPVTKSKRLHNMRMAFPSAPQTVC